MFLKNLKIENDGEVIRDIPFRKGLNLIVDDTPASEEQSSGNNVGKTTVLRLVDFCLNGDGKNIYTDPEFRDKHSVAVEEFLKENNLVVSITLVDDLEDNDSRRVVIRRNFLTYSKKLYEINGETFKRDEYDAKLKQLLFDTTVLKPTFRQIIARTIRDEKNKLTNTLRVLHTTTTFEEYEALYFFWLGIETDQASRKQKLQEQKKIEAKFLTRLQRQHPESEIQQALVIINKDIEELSLQRDALNVSETYQADLDRLNYIDSSINNVTNELNRLSIRRDIIEDSITQIGKGKVAVDTAALKEIYETAKFFIPDMHKRYEDLLAFHNKMQDEKIHFIGEELPGLERRITRYEKELIQLLGQQGDLRDGLKSQNFFDDLDTVIENLNKKHEQKGVYETQAAQLADAKAKLSQIEDDIDRINSGLQSNNESLDNRITAFNEFFSDLSQKLYDEQFILYKEKTDRAYQLKISSLDGNLGTGKKKAQIAAFDLAYIMFCDENDIPCLHFVMQDQTENIHDNQIKILARIADAIGAQYITPILRDKVPAGIDVDSYTVLTLSQSNKLFKIP